MITVMNLTLILIAVYFSLVFILALIVKKISIIDIFWGLGFVGIALFSFFTYGYDLPRQVLVTLLTCLWGLRLTLHLFPRVIRNEEDFRYKKFKENWGKNFYLRAYFQIFLAQGLLMLIIALPIILVNANLTEGFGLLDNIGIVIWSLGFIIETVADYQLKQFIADPTNKGKIMTEGIWAYSRHPNYFGESLIWWGLFCISVSAPYGYITVLSPLVITLLLLFVSGVPLLENKYKNNQEYAEYSKKTSKFILWFPKK